MKNKCLVVNIISSQLTNRIYLKFQKLDNANNYRVFAIDEKHITIKNPHKNSHIWKYEPLKTETSYIEIPEKWELDTTDIYVQPFHDDKPLLKATYLRDTEYVKIQFLEPKTHQFFVDLEEDFVLD